jgi:hypothetical protein
VISKTAVRRTILLAALVLIGSVVSASAEPPNVTSITPNRGSTGGGTITTITGTGFTGTTSVKFGGTAAASFTVLSDTTISATTPAHDAGAYDLVVTNPDATSTLTEGYGFGNVPLAIEDQYTTMFGQTLTVFAPGLLSNDNDSGGGTMAVELLIQPQRGTLNVNADGSFTYTPSPGTSGFDNFRYRGVNGAGNGNSANVSISVAVPTTAQPPSGLHASALSGNRLTLRWTSSPIGLVPTDHEIEVGFGPGSIAGSVRTGSGSPIFSLDAPGGALFIRVRAIAGSSRSDPSNEAVVFVNTPALPTAPENLTGLVNGSSLALAWRNSFGGGVPTGIIVDVSGSIATSIPMGLSDTFTFTGVPPGTYTLSLRALNATGASIPSNAVTLSFPGPCSGVPLPPTNFLVYKVGATIFVVWDPPTGGPSATAYVLNVSGSFFGSFPTTGRAMSGTVGAGTYNLSVTATNACGAGTTTETQVVTIP